MTHDEIEELLGAYALDALDDLERQELDKHLPGCPRCRAELAAHREVAAMLGNAVADSPSVAPEGLWDRISASLQDEPPALVPFRRASLRRRLGVLVPLGAVAAALVLVVGLLAAKVSNLDSKVSTLSSGIGVSSVILNPHHRTIELTSAKHPSWQATVILLNGNGYVINPAMPALDKTQTFQLWALSRGKVVSLGVLGAQPNGVPIRVEPTMRLLMISAEPLGGTPAPTTPVLVQAALPVGV